MAMTLAPPLAPVDELAPILLPHDVRLSCDQFEAVCRANPDAVLELGIDGQMPINRGDGRCSTAPVAFASPMARC